MATQNVNIGINVSDNGTAKKVVKNFQEIESAASKAQRAAAGIGAGPVKSTMAPGGTSGSRRASEPAGSQQMMSGQQYGSARGSAGLTGASARDFANQAQGLGGLVRLYATYAANIFAVGAAFRALSDAMDTSNMVRGLDQLGAASGVALGSLSKELVKATDGAISLRDAMTATAKASSSGMNSEQILRMGKVAQQASQALGVDMADAISRISRGITKLEPELLDELGLFTKTGKAAEEYAKSVGKSTAELTDFERRAAFANAVLEEGEKKFSKIELDVNPYTKLLASIKDLAQAALEFVNKGLAPIVSYLSNSPTALGVAIAALGTVLVKQALPALGEFKAGLASTADRANQLSVQKAQDAAKARLAIDANILTRVEAMADDKVAAVDAAEQKIQALEASGLNKRSAAYKLLQKDITEVTQADIDAVETRAKLAEKGGDTKRAAAYREVTSAVLEQKQAEEDLIVTKKNLSKQLEKDATGMTTYGMTVRAAEKAQTAATRAGIVSNAAYNGSLIGVTASMALMRAEMQAAGIATNTFAGRLLLARGALAAVGGMVSTVMAAFGPLMLIITGLSLAFSLLDGALSKNNKESADLSGSLDKLDANASHLTKTVDALNEKPFLERMSPESLKVKATALGEVSSAISSTINDLLKADKAASGWDRFIDGFKTIWGGDMLSKASKGLATGITDSLANIAGSPEAKALNRELSAILKIDTETASFKQVQDAIKKLGREAPQELKRLEDGFKKVSLASQVTAAKGVELVDAFKKLADLKQTIGNEFLPKDSVTKFGQELIATSQKLSIALDDPQQKLNAIIQLGANAVTIPGATLEQVAALNKAADLAKNIQTLEAKQLEIKQESVKKQQDLVDLVGEQRAALIEAGKPFRWANQTDEDAKKLKSLTNDLKELKASGDVTVKLKTELTSKLEGYSKEIETATLSTYKAGADIVAKQISAEFIKAGKVVSDAYVNIIGETEATIKIKADSEKAVVNAQIQQILSQRDLTIATRELSLRMQERSLQEYRKTNPEAEPDIQARLDTLQPQIQAVEAAKTGDFSKLNLSTNVKDVKNLNIEALNFAQNMRASAAAVNNLRAQLKAIDITALDAITRKRFEPEKKSLENQEKSVSLAKQGLDVQGKLVTQGNLSFLNAKQTLDTKQLDLQQSIALLSNEVETARQDQIIANAKDKSIVSAAEGTRARLVEERKILEAQQEQQKTTLASSQAQERLGALAFNTEEARKREAENAELALAKKLEAFKVEQDLFGLYSSIGLLSETQKINQKFLLEQKSAELDYEQKIAKLKTSSGQQMGQLDSREEAIWTQIGTGTGNQAALIAELDKIAETKALITARTNEEASAAARVRDNTLGIAAATKAAALDQERYNQMLESAGDFANTLKMGFEGAAESSQKIAAALGDVATTMAQVAVNADQRAKSEKLAQESVDKAWESMDYDKVIAAEKAQAEQKKKNAKQELADDIKVLNSSKKLFKEKTAAYKVLDATEKALHIKTLAREGVTLAKQISLWWTGVSTKVAAAVAGEAGTTAATGAGFLARLPIYIKEIYASWGKLGPWMVGAAALFIASKLGGGGGGGGGAFVPTAEQRQETQGTAMSYDSQGNKVQVRRGVFGDTDAQSQSIANSLEIIKDNSVDGLSYDNRMLRALENLNKALISASQSLFGVRGLRSGTLAGVTEGTRTSGIRGLGGKTVSQEVIDSGIQLKGSFADLASASGGLVNSYNTLKTTVNRSSFLGFGGGSSSSTNMVPEDLAKESPQAAKAIREAFAYAEESLFQVSKLAGVADSVVAEAMRKVPIDEVISLRGLSGTEFNEALSAVVGSVLDDASLAIFASFEKYAKFGEGMLETVVRVVDTNTKIDQALKNMGVGFDVSKDYTETITYNTKKFFGILSKTVTETFGKTSKDITEALADAAGGLDKFLEQAEFFRENFLTEAEKLAPVQAAVVTEMARLGFASVDTREEFKQLVQGLNLSTDAGIETYQALMNVQEGFDKVTAASEAAAEKITQEATSLNQQLLQVLGDTAGLRQLELDKLDSSNRALQQRIWNLEDEARVAQERIALEQKVLQIFGNTTKIRELELEKVSSNNKALQMYVWYLEDARTAITQWTSRLKEAESNISAAVSAISGAESKIKSIREQATSNYVSATQKVADAQKAIADIASQAAQKMYDLGKSLRGFIKDTLLGNSQANATSSFESAISGALSGNTTDIENVQSLAEKAIEAARQSSKSSFDFASKQASILASVGKVAEYAQSQGIDTASEDPMVAATKALTDSLVLQSEALSVANSIGASLTSTVQNLFTEFTDATKELQKAILDKSAAEAAAAEAKRVLESISRNTGLSADNISTADFSNKSKFDYLSDTQVERLGTSSDQIPDAIGAGSDATNGTIQDAVSALSTGVMSSIMSNTANSLPLLAANLDNQGSMITLLTAVVNNTKAIADGVTAGSGTSASGSSNIFSKIGSAIGGVVSGVVNTVKKVWKKIFSDVRMKENISLYKTLDNGINIYDFNYKAPYSFALGADRKRGVLAQELESRYPSAVLTSANGMKQVDYSKLPIPSNMLKFATGGVFSNQVVTRPTNFQLAQMGEAGPEAVMPLARTRDGSLGVVAQPGGDAGFTAQLLVQNRALVDEMRALRDEVNLLRYEARATASATTKTTRLLERVTQNGDSLLVTDAATV
jgi:hypothetical protein